MNDRYRPRPVTVEARQWDGTPEQAEELVEWMRDSDHEGLCSPGRRWDNGLFIYVGAPCDHWQTAYPGDWIVRLGPDEFHAYDPVRFAATYEPVPDEEADNE